jgi:hypothetical protein
MKQNESRFIPSLPYELVRRIMRDRRRQSFKNRIQKMEKVLTRLEPIETQHMEYGRLCRRIHVPLNMGMFRWEINDYYGSMYLTIDNEYKYTYH